MSDKGIHRYRFTIEYASTLTAAEGVDRNRHLGSTSLALATRVVNTVKNHLVRPKSGPDRRLVHPKVFEEGDKQYSQIPKLICSVPCEQTALPDLSVQGIDSKIVCGQSKRPNPRTFAVACSTAAWNALHTEADYYDETRGGFLSGPTLISWADVAEQIGSLPVLTEVPPQTASEYMAELCSTSNAIFNLITGGTIPAISCEKIFENTGNFNIPTRL